MSYLCHIYVIMLSFVPASASTPSAADQPRPNDAGPTTRARGGGRGHRAWRARRMYGVMETTHATSSWERAWRARPRATSSALCARAAGTNGDRAAAHASVVGACVEGSGGGVLVASPQRVPALRTGGAPHRVCVRWPRSLGVGVDIIVRSEGTGERRHRARRRRRRSPRARVCVPATIYRSTTTLTTTMFSACECGRFQRAHPLERAQVPERHK